MSVIDTIDKRLEALRPEMKAVDGLYDMFRRCFVNTVETTLQPVKPGDTFVITGDIEAMWLRDSTAQVLHYIRFCDDPEVAALVEGLIARQAECILIDPYANSFNKTDNGRHWTKDEPQPCGHVWEEKYEVDSLCYPILLAWRFYQATGSKKFMTEDFHKALAAVIRVFTTEQDHANSDYYFIRPDVPPLDTLSHGGHGAPVAKNGMTWSGFRPSDDACTLGYLIPSNLFAVQVLPHAAFFAREMGDEELAREAERLVREISEGLKSCATVQDPDLGEIYAYETDGMGNYVMMDDANVPSLLSLPYLGVCGKQDPLYLRTRSFVLSKKNPFYYEGSYAKGVGSPHTPEGYVWHIALCMQIMTTDDEEEQAALIKMILTTHAGTGFIHESFHPDDPEKFTREWFAWANSLFGEMLYRLHEEGKLERILEKVSAML